MTNKKNPKHVAIIMDGNGRWANNNNKTRLEGHKNGVFLKANSIGNRSVSEKNDKSYRSLVPSRSHTSKTANKSEKIFAGVIL